MKTFIRAYGVYFLVVVIVGILMIPDIKKQFFTNKEPEVIVTIEEFDEPIDSIYATRDELLSHLYLIQDRLEVMEQLVIKKKRIEAYQMVDNISNAVFSLETKSPEYHTLYGYINILYSIFTKGVPDKVIIECIYHFKMIVGELVQRNEGVDGGTLNVEY